MSTPANEQIDAFMAKFPGSKLYTENQLVYIFIPKLKLPDGLTPPCVDVLLCPMEHAGYKSRLYFSERLDGLKVNRNWNGSASLKGHTWQAFSWETPVGLSLDQMLATHVRALYED